TLPGVDQFHRFYLEARDNSGAVSLVTVEIRVVKPSFEKSILFFDDFRGNPDQLVPEPYGTYPTEAVLDTLLYAVGGNPDPEWGGTPSKPGVFAGFFSDAQGHTVSDTLDYRFIFVPGLPLSIMGRYKAVVWYCAKLDAGLTGNKFSGNPSGA